MNDIRQIQKFAFTTSLLGITNEDNMSAMQLSTVTVKKLNECVQVINSLCDTATKLINTGVMNVEGEELALIDRFEVIKVDSTKLSECCCTGEHYDAMSALELAGCNAKHVNELARITNELAAAMQELVKTISVEVDNEELIFNTEV